MCLNLGLHQYIFKLFGKMVQNSWYLKHSIRNLINNLDIDESKKDLSILKTFFDALCQSKKIIWQLIFLDFYEITSSYHFVTRIAITPLVLHMISIRRDLCWAPKFRTRVMISSTMVIRKLPGLAFAFDCEWENAGFVFLRPFFICMRAIEWWDDNWQTVENK